MTEERFLQLEHNYWTEGRPCSKEGRDEEGANMWSCLDMSIRFVSVLGSSGSHSLLHYAK